jgi:hypothetical protein
VRSAADAGASCRRGSVEVAICNSLRQTPPMQIYVPGLRVASELR